MRWYFNISIFFREGKKGSNDYYISSDVSHLILSHTNLIIWGGIHGVCPSSRQKIYRPEKYPVPAYFFPPKISRWKYPACFKKFPASWKKLHAFHQVKIYLP